MILDAINSTFATLWEQVSYYVTLQFASPFWYWVFIGTLIIAAALAVSYFFGTWIPALRPLAGFVVVLVSFGWFVYRKAENDTTARLQRRRPVLPKPKPPADGWRW